MKKILVVGNIRGAYRSQFVIDKLIEYDPDEKFIVSFVIPGFYQETQPTTNLLGKVIKKIRSILLNLFVVAEIFFKLPFCDTVFVMAMNHEWFLRVYIANLIWGRKIVTDLYISVYDTAIDRKYFDEPFIKRLRKGWFRWYLQMLDRIIIEKSSIVVHLTKTELVHIANIVNAKLIEGKYAIIPLGVSNKSIAMPSPSDVFRICWWGSWIPLHGLENILLAAKILKDKHFKYRLDLLGTPSDQAIKYQRIIDQYALSSLVVLHQDKSFANNKLEAHLAANCDLALGNFGCSDKAKIVIVNKIIDAFSMQLPVLTMQSDALTEFINDADDLFTCDNTPISIADVIMSLSNKRHELARRAHNGFIRYQEIFSAKSMCDNFISIL